MKNISSVRPSVRMTTRLNLLTVLIALAFSGHVMADTDIGFNDANNVTVHVNTDNASAGAFVVYNGTGTSLPTASIGALNQSSITAYTNGSATAGSAGTVGGQLVVNSNGVNVTAGTLTVGGSTVATTSEMNAANSALQANINSEAATRAAADNQLATDVNNRVVTGSVATLSGLDNGNGGIINAGAIEGATNINATGQITGKDIYGDYINSKEMNSQRITSQEIIGESIYGTNILGENISSQTVNTGTTTTGALNVTQDAIVGGQLAVTGVSTLNGATTVNNTLGVTGLTTTAGVNNMGTLNNTGALSQTGSSTLNGATAINTTGNATTVIGNINSATAVGGALAVTGTSTLNGATTINSTLDVTGLVTTAGVNNTGALNNIGALSQTGSSTLNGTTAINTAGNAATTIGASGNTSAVSLTSGASSVTTSNGVNTLAGVTNSITGTTSINNGVNSTTNLNTGGSTGAVTIGNLANTTSLNSSVNNIGVTALAGAATVNNIGTNDSFASTNSIGNANAGTRVTAYGGNSTVSVSNGSASLISGASGLTTYSNAQTLSSVPAALNAQLNGVGDAASRQTIAGAQYVNRLEGNTLINGNTYINGTLVYTSNNSASTTVTSGASILPDANQATKGRMAIVNSGGAGANVDANGKIAEGITSQSSASLTLTNGVGNTHGLVVTETQATMSGGTRSSSLTLNDSGATFTNAATGAPVQVHGVADGSGDFDAVNKRQLKQVAAGVAGATAMANIPQVDQNKTFAVGVGVGNFQSQTSLALGASYRAAPNTVIKASLSGASGVSKSTSIGMGVGYSW